MSIPGTVNPSPGSFRFTQLLPKKLSMREDLHRMGSNESLRPMDVLVGSTGIARQDSEEVASRDLQEVMHEVDGETTVKSIMRN